MKKIRLLASTVAVSAGLLAGTMSAKADCGIEKGSVRILSNDFEALRVVVSEAEKCASASVKVTKNQTTEHKNLQVPALRVNPAEYTVAMIANNSIVPLLNEGLIRPMDDLVAKYGQDLQPNQLIKLDGKIMAIAFMGNSQHLYFRKDILDKAGLSAPKTYEDILAAAKVIREKGLMQYPLAASDKAGWDLAAEFVNMYLGYGGELFQPGSAAPAINNEKGLATLKMMKDLTAYMSPDYMTFNADELAKVYVSGKTAIMNEWGSLAGGIVDPKVAPADIVKDTVLAAAPTVGGGSTPAAALWWDGFAIAKNISDEDAEASFRAMIYGTRPEVGKAHADIATWLTKDYVPGAGAVGVLATANGGAIPYPMLPYMGLLHTALGSELADFMQGRESAENALGDVEASYSAAAKEGGFLK
ncbi:extracellular solute-binding protein [Rhizobium lusitanum]|uniref:Extracellular solute-binding protein n=1 Tax=Rhizobium lusitanum TaxID=293958 RepID=A0A6L9UFQ5_9HYPH|nr:extracellular solute-binding protein [Rhizobium lusitanum]NEI74189.1 extracellular solute-binding protein [Rhizobium lusitanum]